MVISFQQLWEQMDDSVPLMDSGEEPRAMAVIRSGLDLHPDDETSFWQDFMDLASNTEGMAELLDIRPEQVSRWSQKIQDYIEKTEAQDSQDPAKEDDKEVFPTGDNGAITTPSNQDPYLGDF
jgi:hypothetical protein